MKKVISKLLDIYIKLYNIFYEIEEMEVNTIKPLVSITFLVFKYLYTTKI